MERISKTMCLAAMMLAGMAQSTTALAADDGETPTLAEPVTKLADLTIVKEYEMTLPLPYGSKYENITVSTTLDGIYDALGAESSVLDEVVADYTFTRTVKDIKESEDGIPVYAWNEDLAKPGDAAVDGWFGLYYQDTDDGTEAQFFGNAPKSWGAGNNTFYTQKISLNDGEFSILTGQYPGVLNVGDKYDANLYIINGDKAALVRLVTDVYVPVIPAVEELTSVGDTTIAIEAEANDEYVTKTFRVNIEKICSLLGCETTDISKVYGFADANTLTGDATADNGGFFFKEDGTVGGWSDNVMFYITAAGLSNGKFAIGQRPTKFTGIEENRTVEASFVFLHGEKYYKVNLKYTVTPAVQHETPTEFTLKSVEYLGKQIVPHESVYDVNANTVLDLDYIESIIGTKDFKIYADQISVNEEDQTTTVKMGDNYNCDPKPGFWFGSTEIDAPEYRNCVSADGWSPSSSFGVSYSDGELVWFRYPGTHNAGDTYTANLYLVNEQTADYIKYVIMVKYVEEIEPEPEVVAEESSVVFVDESSDDSFRGLIDSDKVCELLGIDNLASSLDDVAVVFAKSPTMTLIDNLGSYAAFAKNGYVTDDEDNGAFAVTIDVDESGKLYILADYIDADNKQIDAVANIGIQYAGKRIMFKVTFSTTDPATGVAVVGADSDVRSSVYSLSGTKVLPNAKGLNIIHGKKVLVK